MLFFLSLLLAVDVRLQKDGHGSYVFEVSGVADCNAVAVFVVAGGADNPPLLGACARKDGTLAFRPRFSLTPGVRYRVVVGGSFERVFEIPAERLGPSTIVEHVYPSASVVPENLLKFYFHFSAPMSRGEAYQRIRLLDSVGAQVEAPFLELDEELWDREGRRLTVLLDPGRIKRDLVPNREVGPPLSAQGRYTLVVDRNWRDARGVPLREEYRKIFSVGEPDHAIPALRLWRVGAPKAGTKEPLIVTFPEPLDHSLLGRLLEVRDASGAPVPGAASIERNETEWRFIPSQLWSAGFYLLRVGTTLEDLAGNRINRPFEVDRFEKIERQTTAEWEELRLTAR